VEEATPQGESELFHYLTENDRANSLPPDITAEMYHTVVDPRLFVDTSVSFAEDGNATNPSHPIPLLSA
jgi:hypothetical protein